MNEKALHVLEFDKILNYVSDLASSSMAKEKILNLKPMNDLDEITKKQNETSGARDMITHSGAPSFEYLKDLKDIFLRLDVDATLSIPEILRVLRMLETTSSIKSYYNENEVKETSFENLFINLTTLIDLQNEIRRCIISEDEIADDASIELRNIRRQIKMLQNRVREKLNEMVSSQTYRSMLNDTVITLKDNRYCLPVKAEFKNQLKGIVHEESASGQTLFIEPLQVVEINNKLKEFEKKEADEIERILYRISYELKENYSTIENDYNILIILDTIFAKGKYSKEIDGTRPKFNESGYINLKMARHPLIDKDKIVPIDVSLGKNYKSLIITGPNTGGKTVTLKTIGLTLLMGMSGLHIPAFDGSELSVFEEVFADIGDEQSIEQSLSTFSSHMKNLVEITDKADEKSLVLLDEIGAGTDPIEGAQLAISILKYLKNNGAFIVATTHYSELKHYGLTEEGVINASCEFDVNTLMPTYRLLIGIPGKSNAFEISKKLGLNDFIIKNAREGVSSDNVSFEDAIKAASDEKERAEKEANLAEAYKEEIRIQKEDYEKKIQKLKEEKEKVLNDARKKALEIIEDSKEEARDIIEKMKQKAKEFNEKLNAKDMSELKAELEKSTRDLEEKMRKEKEATWKVNENRVKVKVGMEVYCSNLDKKGIVKVLPDKNDEVTVEVGILKVKVPMKYVFESDVKEKNKKTTVKTNSSSVRRGKMEGTGFEINVIGLYPNEALMKVEKFIDDAVVACVPVVRVVHGKGAGVLRKEIHQMLKSNPYVDSYRLGEFGEGDSGVTIVTLK